MFLTNIYIDLQMPLMNGFKATTAIRAIEAKRKNKKKSWIAALTGLATEEDRSIAFATGIDEFLTKPISLKQLDKVFRSYTEIN